MEAFLLLSTQQVARGVAEKFKREKKNPSGKKKR